MEIIVLIHFVFLAFVWWKWSHGEINEAPFRLLAVIVVDTLLFIAYVIATFTLL